MDPQKIIEKFGKAFAVNEATFVMGINHRLAEKIALRFQGHKRVLDACSGAGFMSLAFAKHVPEVIAVDISPEHLAMAEQNAKIAGMESKVHCVLGDVSSDEVLNNIGDIDGVNMDMDWAIGEDKRVHVTKFSQMIPPAGLLFAKLSKKTANISIRLPKELDLGELKSLPPHELEKVYLDGAFKFYMAYFGDLIKKVGESELRV